MGPKELSDEGESQEERKGGGKRMEPSIGGKSAVLRVGYISWDNTWGSKSVSETLV